MRTVCVLVKLLQSRTSLCMILCDPRDNSQPGFSVHEILQARILEWLTILFSRGSSRPRDWTRVSCIAGSFYTVWDRVDKQQGLIIQHRKLYSLSMINHNGKEYERASFYSLVCIELMTSSEKRQILSQIHLLCVSLFLAPNIHENNLRRPCLLFTKHIQTCRNISFISC